jgi:hypothetical protein
MVGTSLNWASGGLGVGEDASSRNGLNPLAALRPAAGSHVGIS